MKNSLPADLRKNIAKGALCILSLLPTLPVAQANVVGTGSQNFNTTTSGLDFVTVQSSDTLEPGILNLGLFANYAVNTLTYFNLSPQGRTQWNDGLLGADFNFGLGLMKGWDFGVSFPYFLEQNVSDQSDPRGQFTETGNTEVRVNTKFHLLGNSDHGLAAVLSVNFNRVQNDPFAGAGAGPTYDFELAYGKKVGAFKVGLNAGFRLFNSGTPIADSPIQPFGNQLIFSGAVSYLVTSLDTKVIAEVFGGMPAQSTTSDLNRTESSAEAILGMKHDFTHEIAFHFGGGTRILNGISSPDWRIYTGINVSLGPLFSRHEAQALIPVPVASPQERFVTRDLYFDFDKSELKGDYEGVLKNLAEHLENPPGFTALEIEGHTDSIGPHDYNMSLSERRATAVRDYLVNTLKIDPAKLKPIGYGPDRPVADNGNYQGREENRRVEFLITR
jgi:outer membrane protein OmpA-like peptidoglycan-associated protein